MICYLSMMLGAGEVEARSVDDDRRSRKREALDPRLQGQ